MQQAPFDEKYEDLHIWVHNISATHDFWTMDSSDGISGTPLSNVWIHAAVFTDIPTYKDLVTNFALILRNQSDYSNVIILIGTLSIEAALQRVGAPRMLLKMTEFLFDKAELYAKEINLKGKDGKDFIMPSFHYTDDFFKNMAKED